MESLAAVAVDWGRTDGRPGLLFHSGPSMSTHFRLHPHSSDQLPHRTSAPDQNYKTNASIFLSLANIANQKSSHVSFLIERITSTTEFLQRIVPTALRLFVMFLWHTELLQEIFVEYFSSLETFLKIFCCFSVNVTPSALEASWTGAAFCWWSLSAVLVFVVLKWFIVIDHRYRPSTTTSDFEESEQNQ